MSQNLVDRIAQTDNISVIGKLGNRRGTRRGSSSALTPERGSRRDRTGRRIRIVHFIGVASRTEPFRPLVATDDKGFILTGVEAREAARGWGLAREPMMFETSVPGIFAAGDVCANANRRIAAVVGEGSASIFSVHQYLRSV